MLLFAFFIYIIHFHIRNNSFWRSVLVERHHIFINSIWKKKRKKERKTLLYMCNTSWKCSSNTIRLYICYTTHSLCCLNKRKWSGPDAGGRRAPLQKADTAVDNGVGLFNHSGIAVLWRGAVRGNGRFPDGFRSLYVFSSLCSPEIRELYQYYIGQSKCPASLCTMISTSVKDWAG